MDLAECGCPTDGEFIYHMRDCRKKREGVFRKACGLPCKLWAKVERLKAEKEWLTHQAISLCRYAATGKLRNEQEWMRGLADRINDVLRELGDSSRVRFLVTEFRVESIKAAEAAGGDA